MNKITEIMEPHRVALPKQVWRHYKGQEVLVEAIEYTLNAISEGAALEMRGKSVTAAGDIEEDSALVVYSHDGKCWVRSMADFLEALGDRQSSNTSVEFYRFELVHDPRIRRKRTQEGFTLIELLVVITLAGLLAAIALPSFLGAANRGRQVEARNYVGSINRAQQVLLLEAGKFGTLVELGNPIPEETPNYTYTVNPTATQATILATPKRNSTPAVSGIIVLREVGTTGEFTTLSAVCPGTLTPAIGCDQ